MVEQVPSTIIRGRGSPASAAGGKIIGLVPLSAAALTPAALPCVPEWGRVVRLPYDRHMTTGVRAEGKLTVLDLFAGAGGLSEGFHRSGYFRTVQAVEMEPAAAATYSLNHPEVDLFAGPIEDWLAAGRATTVDVVVGGPPCQGFSTLGKQDGRDARNGLWREYVRTIVDTRPTYFVLENVAAFLNSPEYWQLRAQTTDGGALRAYKTQAAILNSADYGAPQARRRAVLIGHLRSVPFPGWPKKTHEHRHVTVRDTFRSVPGSPDPDLPPRSFEFANARFSCSWMERTASSASSGCSRPRTSSLDASPPSPGLQARLPRRSRREPEARNRWRLSSPTTRSPTTRRSTSISPGWCGRTSPPASWRG